MEGDAFDQPGEGFAILGDEVRGHVIHDALLPMKMPPTTALAVAGTINPETSGRWFCDDAEAIAAVWRRSGQ